MGVQIREMYDSHHWAESLMAVTTSYVAFWHVDVRLGTAMDAADEEGIRTLAVVDRVVAA